MGRLQCIFRLTAVYRRDTRAMVRQQYACITPSQCGHASIVSLERRHVGVRYFGASVSRREDPRLLRGQGRYVDDIKLPGMLHATIVRSPHAHARLNAIRIEAAGTARVAGVFRFTDLAAWMKPMPSAGLPPPNLKARLDITLRTTPQFPLAHDRVRYVGEPVAVVVAHSRATAEDAAERLEIAYEPLPAVVDTEAALAADAPRLFADWPNNVAVRFTHAIGDAEHASRTAEWWVRERFRVHRYTGTPLECRGVVVEPQPVDQRLTMWSATQFPTLCRVRWSKCSDGRPTACALWRPTWEEVLASKPAHIPRKSSSPWSPYNSANP